MTKLHTAVAAMVAVEKGLIKLNDEVGKFVPELAEPDILVGFEDDGEGAPILRKAKNKITMRYACQGRLHSGVQLLISFKGTC
jgi:CubicO group peptidase (beta-lactamase class C family)